MDVFQKNSTMGLNYCPSSAYPFVLCSMAATCLWSHLNEFALVYSEVEVD